MAIRKSILSLLAISLLAVTAAPAFAIENWPMFNHDPQMSGRTQAYVSGTMSKKWEIQFAQGAYLRSQPIVANDVLYYATMDGIFSVMNVRTKAAMWGKNTGGMIFGSPAVSAGRAIIAVSYGDHGEIQGYDLNGTLKWNVTTTDPVSASPIIYRGLVIVGAHDRNVYAVDIEDGTLVWKSSIGGRVMGAAAADKGIIVVAADDMKGYAFDMSGARLWVTSLPGETIRDTHPLIAADTVLFTTTARANDYAALEDQPYYGDHPLDSASRQFNPPESILTQNETYYTQNPAARTSWAVNLQTGSEKFKVALGAPYWGTITPSMLTSELAIKHSYTSAFSINMRTGEIKFMTDSTQLPRPDEYGYSSIGGGKREYMAMVDDLGMYDYTALRKSTLVGDFYSHAVSSWAHPPDATNKYLTAPGPGDGNSGYAGTPVVYDNLIIWQNSGSWLMAHQGTGGNEVADTTASTVPASIGMSAHTSSTVSLTWSASTDAVGVYGYRIYRNNVLIAETDTISYTDVNLLPNTTYQYTVSAFDRLNNESGKSSVLNGTTGNGPVPSPSNTLPSPSPSPVADVNQDGVVDTIDIKKVLLEYAKMVSAVTGYREPDTDGKVNAIDFSWIVKALR